MPLWLDMLRTPMAAPETRKLARLRIIWEYLCHAVCVSMLAFQPLRAWLGDGASILVLLLLIPWIVISIRYFRMKNRADNLWLKRPDLELRVLDPDGKEA